MLVYGRQLHFHGPSPIRIPGDHPMGHDADRLMNQFKTTFALAYGFYGEAPEPCRTIARPLDVETKPFVDQANEIAGIEAERCAQIAP